MAALTQLLLTARDALSAQSFGLGVTGQNVSNVNTPGYVRRDAVLENRVTGGVVATGVRRAADQFLDRRWLSASSLASGASERHSLLTRIEGSFDDRSGTGIGTAIDDFFAGFSAIAASPSDSTTRQSLIDRAAALAQRLRETADALASEREDLLQRAQQVVEEVNTKAAAIATLNRQIGLAESQGGDASDLRDEQSRLLLGLSSLIDVRTLTDQQGHLVVQSSGATLIEGDQAAAFEVDLTSGGELRLRVTTSGPPATDVTQWLSGGALRGIKDVRDSDLGAMATRLDQLAWDLGGAVNTQHALGFGLDGVTGRSLFTMSAGVSGAAAAIALDAAMVGHPERLAASKSGLTLPGGSDNAVALAAIAAQKIAGGGTRTASAAWGDLVGDVGTRVARAGQEAELRDNVVRQASALRESMGGVALDEEMVQLTKYQRAYAASAKVLATVDELLRELIDRVAR